MKKTLLVVVSLVANAILLGALLQRSHRTELSDPARGSAASATARAAAPATNANRVDPDTWSALTTGDLAETAARLRTAGYPRSLQRAILSALMAERFADRHKAIADMIDAQPWWRGNLYGSAGGAKVVAARQALQREEKEAIDQWLGPDPGTSEYQRAKQARQNGELSPDKAAELNRIISDYNEMITETRSAAQNVLLPEDRAKIALLEKEKRADIAKLLSAEELFEYDLRSSPTANQLRFTLAAFSPSDDEYRAIFKVQLPFDSRYGSPELMTADQTRQRRAEQPELIKQIKAVLSPDRFAEYQLKTDNAYIQANALVTRLQLPATATAEIVAIQKDITKRADAIRADPTLQPAQRAPQYAALGAEAATRLAPTLGEKGLAAYKQSSGGGWLNSLQRPPAPPAAAPKP
jgi:hypothetical protein